MSDTVRWTSGQAGRQETKTVDGANLADILERVLDKGIVIAGDIQVNLLDIELLTIKIRLVVASVDRAKEMGIDWWERDPTLSAGRQELEDENDELRSRIAALEAAMARGPALPERDDPDQHGPDQHDPDQDDPEGEAPSREDRPRRRAEAGAPRRRRTEAGGRATAADGRPAPRRGKGRER